MQTPGNDDGDVMATLIVRLADGRYVGNDGPTWAMASAHVFSNQTAAAFHVEGALNVDVRSVVFIPVRENGAACGCDPPHDYVCEWHREEKRS